MSSGTEQALNGGCRKYFKILGSVVYSQIKIEKNSRSVTLRE
jgi:hypothetical protein